VIAQSSGAPSVKVDKVPVPDPFALRLANHAIAGGIARPET
jgi:hypothetical protein